LATLGTPKLRLILSDPEFPGADEGKDYDVQVRNVDLCAYDRERGRYGWPKGEDAPFIWMTFIGWKALIRTGQIPQCTLTDFEQRCLSVETAGETPVDPTQPAATDG
jgi:hypothetical protein